MNELEDFVQHAQKKGDDLLDDVKMALIRNIPKYDDTISDTVDHWKPLLEEWMKDFVEGGYEIKQREYVNDTH